MFNLEAVVFVVLAVAAVLACMHGARTSGHRSLVALAGTFGALAIAASSLELLLRR